MRLALQVERGRRNADLEARGFAPERLDLSVNDALDLATIRGARAVHLDSRIGSLAPGKQADIVCLRTDRIGMTPATDAAAAAVLYANAGDVDSVFVAGRAVKRGGRLVGADVARVRDELGRSRERIAKRASTIAREDARQAVRSFFPLE
jgi:cytosine/adenosine deaminase-related metal-dependent hydrolase